MAQLEILLAQLKRAEAQKACLDGMLRETAGWDDGEGDIGLSGTWDESKHHRGQPGNAGEFGPSGASGASAQSAPQKQDTAQQSGKGGGAATQQKPARPDSSEAIKTAQEDYQKNGTRAKAFLAWFGNWESDPKNSSKVLTADKQPHPTQPMSGMASSKVTDPETGRPIVVYHGTKVANLDEFRKDAGGNGDKNVFGRGFYFAATEGHANKFEGPDGATHAVYLNIRKPFDLDKEFTREEAEQITGQKWGMLKSITRLFHERGPKTGNPTGHELFEAIAKAGGGNDAATKRIQELGYDGMTHTQGAKASGEASKNEAWRVWIAFDPNQVKAVNNRGTFDPDNPKIALSTWDATKHPRGDDANKGHFAKGLASTVAIKVKSEIAATHDVLHEIGTEAFHSLPEPVQDAVKTAAGVAFTGWTASQALAERVSREKGSTPDEAAKTRSVLAAWDLAAFKPVAVLSHFAGPVAGIASWVVPPVTACYLAYNLVRHPIATFLAAYGLIKNATEDAADVVKDHVELSAGSESQLALVDALEEHGWDDWYCALLHAAILHTKDIGKAIQSADAVFAKHPKNESVPRDDDADTLFASPKESPRRSIFNKRKDISLSTDAKGHEHKGTGEGGGQFTSKGGGAGAKPAESPKHGSRAAALHAQHEAWKKARVEAFNEIKTDAERVNSHAEQLTDAFNDLYGGINSGIGDEGYDNAFNELEEHISSYEHGALPSERFSRLKEIETAAKHMLAIEPTRATERTTKQQEWLNSAEAEQQRLEKMVWAVEGSLAAVRQNAVKEPPESIAKDVARINKYLAKEGYPLSLAWDGPNVVIDDSKMSDAVKAANDSLGDNPHKITYKHGRVGLQVNDGEMPVGLAPEAIADNKQRLQSIITNTRAARAHLKAYVQHRKEMQAIKEGSPMDVRLSMAMPDEINYSLSVAGDDAIHLSARAPKGYTKEKPLQVQGQSFVGGEYIPGDVMAKATRAEKAAIKGTPQDSQKSPASAPTPSPAGDKRKDAYVAQAMANLKKTSRTASGTVDTSASKGKAGQMAEGLTGSDAAAHATKNFESVVGALFDQRDHDYSDPQRVQALCDNVNKELNRGITKEGVLLRTDDSDKFPYTKVADIPLARQQFAEEFAKRLSDPNADPIETAAWVEWRVNRDHVYADGVGKSQRALAALPLMRANLPLPNYDDPKKFFKFMPSTPPDPKKGPESYTEGEDYKRFLNYYRMKCPAYGTRAVRRIEKHYPPANPMGADALERHSTGTDAHGLATYTPERAALHAKIAQKLRGSVPTSKDKTYMIMGGGPAPLALDTLIPTPTGWTTINDVKVGDTIFDGDGMPTEVVMVSPIFHDRQCYRLSFDDGTEVVADGEHQWVTSTRASRRSRSRRLDRGYAPDIQRRARDMAHCGLDSVQIGKNLGVSGTVAWRWVTGRTPVAGRVEDDSRTTLEILATLVRPDGCSPNHAVENHKGIQTDEAALPVPPYTLGAWLGDGTSSCGAITSADEEIPDRIRRDGFDVKKREDDKQHGQASHYSIYGLIPGLRQAGVFNNKHIPAIYLRASIEQRIALLQGLMDTDGHCNKFGSCEFLITNHELAKGMHELLASLGIKSRISAGVATLYGRAIGPKWRLGFCAPFHVFSLQRKKDRQRLHGSKPRRRLIRNVEPVESVPVRCLKVASLASTFLITPSMLMTHNSGKSSVVKMGLVKKINGEQITLPDQSGKTTSHVHIDSDVIKGDLPEMQLLRSQGDMRAADYVHEESSDVAKSIQAQSFAAGQDVLLDGTGDNSVDAVEKKCKAARAAGYKVQAAYTTCSTEEAVRRNVIRAFGGPKAREMGYHVNDNEMGVHPEGRLPPEDMLRAVHKGVSTVLPELLKKAAFDQVTLHDTEHKTDGKPTLVMSAKGGEVTIHHPELWQSFLGKAKG